MGFLLVWWLMFIFAHDWIYQLHKQWFQLTITQFDGIHYKGMIAYKLLTLIFALVPYLALSIIN